jgi:hypothetical protein
MSSIFQYFSQRKINKKAAVNLSAVAFLLLIVLVGS